MAPALHLLGYLAVVRAVPRAARTVRAERAEMDWGHSVHGNVERGSTARACQPADTGEPSSQRFIFGSRADPHASTSRLASALVTVLTPRKTRLVRCYLSSFLAAALTCPAVKPKCSASFLKLADAPKPRMPWN